GRGGYRAGSRSRCFVAVTVAVAVLVAVLVGDGGTPLIVRQSLNIPAPASQYSHVVGAEVAEHGKHCVNPPSGSTGGVSYIQSRYTRNDPARAPHQTRAAPTGRGGESVLDATSACRDLR